MERSIKETLESSEAYLYRIFLQKALEHSSEYVSVREKNKFDVSKVYNLRGEYYDLYK